MITYDGSVALLKCGVAATWMFVMSLLLGSQLNQAVAMAFVAGAGMLIIIAVEKSITTPAFWAFALIIGAFVMTKETSQIGLLTAGIVLSFVYVIIEVQRRRAERRGEEAYRFNASPDDSAEQYAP